MQDNSSLPGRRSTCQRSVVESQHSGGRWGKPASRQISPGVSETHSPAGRRDGVQGYLEPVPLAETRSLLQPLLAADPVQWSAPPRQAPSALQREGGLGKPCTLVFLELQTKAALPSLSAASPQAAVCRLSRHPTQARPRSSSFRGRSACPQGSGTWARGRRRPAAAAAGPSPSPSRRDYPLSPALRPPSLCLWPEPSPASD